LTVFWVHAKLSLPSVFSDGVVLQVWNEGDARSFINGETDLGAKVTLEVTNDGSGYTKTYTTFGDGTTGIFAIQIDGTYIGDQKKQHIPHYGPANFTLKASNESITILDVRFGDVYLCIGDEDMGASITDMQPQDTPFAPFIRHFSIPQVRSQMPQEGMTGGRWSRSTDRDYSNFSALCHGTAVELSRLYGKQQPDASTEAAGVPPIGLIAATSAGSLLSEWSAGAVLAPRARCQVPNGGALYNGMLHPLRRLAIRSVLFAQGEADVHTLASSKDTSGGYDYAACLQEVVQGMRDMGNIGDYSFVISQFASPRNSSGLDGAKVAAAVDTVRMGQVAALPRALPDKSSFQADEPNEPDPVTTTALASSVDYGLMKGRAKMAVMAQRMAAATLHAGFAKQAPGVGWTGPVLQAATRTAVDTVRLSFAFDVASRYSSVFEGTDSDGEACSPSAKRSLIQFQLRDNEGSNSTGWIDMTWHTNAKGELIIPTQYRTNSSRVSSLWLRSGGYEQASCNVYSSYNNNSAPPTPAPGSIPAVPSDPFNQIAIPGLSFLVEVQAAYTQVQHQHPAHPEGAQQGREKRQQEGREKRQQGREEEQQGREKRQQEGREEEQQGREEEQQGREEEQQGREEQDQRRRIARRAREVSVAKGPSVLLPPMGYNRCVVPMGYNRVRSAYSLLFAHRCISTTDLRRPVRSSTCIQLELLSLPRLGKGPAFDRAANEEHRACCGWLHFPQHR
jgi:hypothetical protein